MNLTDLENKLSSESAKFTHDLLIGNGFGKSHHDENMRKYFEFDPQSLDTDISLEIKNQIKCPEEFLGKIRFKVKSSTINKYIDKEIFNLRKDLKTDKAILSKARGIFTLNYDPILYYWLLKFTDKGENFVTPQVIFCKKALLNFMKK